VPERKKKAGARRRRSPHEKGAYEGPHVGRGFLKDEEARSSTQGRKWLPEQKDSSAKMEVTKRGARAAEREKRSAHGRRGGRRADDCMGRKKTGHVLRDGETVATCPSLRRPLKERGDRPRPAAKGGKGPCPQVDTM